MTRYISLVVLIIGLTVMLSCSATQEAAGPTPTPYTGPSRGKVLLIVREQGDDLTTALTKEVATMMPMLENAGFEVIVATPSGQPVVTSATTLTADLALGDVRVDDYVGVMVPCMTAGNSRPMSTEAVEIVQEASAKALPIAAQHSALLILDAAGVLDGKQYAALEFTAPRGIRKGHGVVQDGNIITASTCPHKARPKTGRPDTTVELTDKLIASLVSTR
jgi:putative intracellular protease/amidase